MRKMKILSLGLSAALLVMVLSACGQSAAQPAESPAQSPVETAETDAAQPPAVREESPAAVQEAELGELEALIGLSDEEAASCFGTSEENWTEDKSFFIGRIYQVSLYGEPVKLFTTYSDENKVVSVSAWITDGTREVTEEEAQLWVQRITDYAGAEPSFDNSSSEGGSQNWKWKSENSIIALRWLGDLLTIDMQPAVGELK